MIIENSLPLLPLSSFSNWSHKTCYGLAKEKMFGEVEHEVLVIPSSTLGYSALS